jgi:hypothetical protein
MHRHLEEGHTQYTLLPSLFLPIAASNLDPSETREMLITTVPTARVYLG